MNQTETREAQGTSLEVPESGWLRIRGRTRHFFRRTGQPVFETFYESVCGRFITGLPGAKLFDQRHDPLDDCMHCARAYRKLQAQK